MGARQSRDPGYLYDAMTRPFAVVLALVAASAGPAGAQAAKNYTPADVHFVAGMIGHHAQAIQMAGWAPSHGAGPSVRVLCERIVVAQNDEIVFAQRWLKEHGEYVPPADPRGHIMQGMEHPMLMPGMNVRNSRSNSTPLAGPSSIGCS